jgi:hypothetical protein
MLPHVVGGIWSSSWLITQNTATWLLTGSTSISHVPVAETMHNRFIARKFQRGTGRVQKVGTQLLWDSGKNS